MKNKIHPHFMVHYHRCNSSLDEFCLKDWASCKADVLWVAALLDNLPNKIVFKKVQFSAIGLIHSRNIDSGYFLASIHEMSRHGWEEIPLNPFLTSSGLHKIKVFGKLSERTIAFRFDFPKEGYLKEPQKASGK